MPMPTFYPGKVNSPSTEITSAITATDTTATVADASVLPAAPNLATIGVEADAETIQYTAITGNTLTVVRGFEGIAKAWDTGSPIGRYYTEYDHQAFIDGINTAEKTASDAQTAADDAQKTADKGVQSATIGGATVTKNGTELQFPAYPTAPTKASLGLGNVDNTSDANKPVSTAQQRAIDKVAARPLGTSGVIIIRATDWAASGTLFIANVTEATATANTYFIAGAKDEQSSAAYQAANIWKGESQAGKLTFYAKAQPSEDITLIAIGWEVE